MVNAAPAILSDTFSTPFTQGLQKGVASSHVNDNLHILSKITPKHKLYFNEIGQICLEVDDIARKALGQLGQYTFGYAARDQQYTSLENLVYFSKYMRSKLEEIAMLETLDAAIRGLKPAVNGLIILSSNYVGIPEKKPQLSFVNQTIEAFQELTTRFEDYRVLQRVGQIGWHLYFAELIEILLAQPKQDHEKNIKTLTALLERYSHQVEQAKSKGLLLSSLFTLKNKLRAVTQENKNLCLAEMIWGAFSRPENQESYQQRVNNTLQNLMNIENSTVSDDTKLKLEISLFKKLSLFPDMLLIPL